MTYHLPFMAKRPLSVTIIGWLFIATGAIGFVYHLSEATAPGALSADSLWVLAVRLMAIGIGAALLRGSNAARWLLLVWIAYHVVLSAFHSMSGVITHAALLAAVAYFLFRPDPSAYFRGEKGPQPG